MGACAALAQTPADVAAHGAVAVQATVQTLAPTETEALLNALPVDTWPFESLAQLDPMAHEASNAEQAAEADSDAENRAGNAGSTPGTVPGSETAISFGGLAATQNSLIVDGLSSNQSFRSSPRGTGFGAGFGQVAVRSLRVMPYTFSARYGGSVGGVLALATRAATTHLHGSGYMTERSTAWAATNPYSVETHYRDGVVSSAAVKPAGTLTQFGASAESPVAGRGLPPWLRNRMGALGALEVQLHDDHIVSTPAAANFYALSAEQIALLGNRGVGTAAKNTALNYLDSLSGETARHAWRLQGFGLVDARLSKRDELTAGYNGMHFNAPAGATLGQASEAVVARGTGSLGSNFVAIDEGMARWLHAFSSRWNNELRTQLAHDLEYETPHAPLAQEPAIGPGGYAPEVSIAPDGFAYGTPANLGRIAYPDELRIELADDMEWRLGKHLLSAGADWSRLHDRIASITAAEGAFSYDSGVTGGYDGGLVDWITDYTFNVNAYPNGGCPSINAATHYFCFYSYRQSFGPLQTKFVTHELAGFVEDAWNVRGGISLTAGMRYDFTLLPLPQAPNYTLDADLAALALPIGGATQTFPEDRNNFGPRLGVSWGTRWFVAHLGYGWFYGRVPGATVRAALTDTALAQTTEHVRIRRTTETACPQAPGQGFGYPCAYTSAPPLAVATTSSATLFASRYRTPAVQRAELSLERALGRRAQLQLSYAMALAEQLPNSVDINIAPSLSVAQYQIQGGDGHPGIVDGQSFRVPLYTQRRLTAYGPVTALVSNANATYYAAAAEGHVQLTRSLELRGAYTFSRSIDYGAQSSATPALNGQFDPFNHGYDKGLSSQQVPQRFAGSLLWHPRVTHGPLLLRRALDNWHLSALTIAASGAPYSYMIFGGTYLSGGRDSINGSGGATYLPTVGRDTLHLPAHGRVDARIQREFAATARMHCEIFVQAFNLLNTQTITSVQTRAFLPGTPQPTASAPNPPTPLIFQDAAALATEGLTTTLPFGAPRSSTSGFNHERQIELGLRVRF